MALVIDESGNPFVIVREQEKKKRLTGIEAQKANILACTRLGNMLKSSLGPRGMDKIIVSADGEITVTNDGATIMKGIDINHQCAQLLADLSKSQDEEVGDGTTGVVVFAAELLAQAARLLDKKIHPIKIAEAFEAACKIAVSTLHEISRPIDPHAAAFRGYLKASALTALSSKVVSSHREALADMCVQAVLAVADAERADVIFDLIKVEGKPGGRLEDSQLVEGIVLDKGFSHPQMRKRIDNAKIAILTCPFEPPKLKTKHRIDIKNAEDCKTLLAQEQKYFVDMVDKCKNSGANVIICQWGMDDEANHLLFKADLPTVRWVGGNELELISLATGGRIVPRFEELTTEKLGTAQVVREEVSGTDNAQVIVIEGCPKGKAVTILLRGGNSQVVEEAKRSVHDALCVVRNLVRKPQIVPGGGAPEVACSLAVEKAALVEGGAKQYGMKAFAAALNVIPEALAVNAGLDGVSTLGAIRARQMTDSTVGLVCRPDGSCHVTDAFQEGVHESLQSKQMQLELPTQVTKMILKIDDVIATQELNM